MVKFGGQGSLPETTFYPNHNLPTRRRDRLKRQLIRVAFCPPEGAIALQTEDQLNVG